MSTKTVLAPNSQLFYQYQYDHIANGWNVVSSNEHIAVLQKKNKSILGTILFFSAIPTLLIFWPFALVMFVLSVILNHTNKPDQVVIRNLHQDVMARMNNTAPPKFC